MQHKTVDDAFMNFAYVSEEWLARFLADHKKRFPQAWNKDRERQLQDEVRHSKMILDILERNKATVFHDLLFSIQEAVYHRGGLLDMSEAHGSDDAFEAVQSVIERRAGILYKIYLRLGKNESYKKLIRQILEDEDRHLTLSGEDLAKSPIFQYCEKVDKFLFKRISEKYGTAGDMRSSVINHGFWEDLFNKESVV